MQVEPHQVEVRWMPVGGYNRLAGKSLWVSWYYNTGKTEYGNVIATLPATEEGNVWIEAVIQIMASTILATIPESLTDA